MAETTTVHKHPLLNALRMELQHVLEKDVKITKIFGEYVSLSVSGVVLLKEHEGDLYFNMSCACGEQECPINQVATKVPQHYTELNASGGGQGYFCLGEPELSAQKRLCVDILACQSKAKVISANQDLVAKGSITRKLAIRLGRIGINTLDDLLERTVPCAYHDLRDAFPADTTEKHLILIEARVLNKISMFMGPAEIQSVRSRANVEFGKRVRRKIEASRMSAE